MKQIKFKIEKIDNKAVVIKVSYGNFTDDDSSNTAFFIPKNNDDLINVIEIALNSLLNNKGMEVIDGKTVYSDSFLERFLKHETN